MRRVWRYLVAVGFALAAACFALQFWDGRRELMRRDGTGLTGLELSRGNLSIAWRPSVPYRPQWAGQINRHGFRYNRYSDGSGYAWAPMWSVGAVIMAATVVAILADRLLFRRRQRKPGLCPRCGYDLRATPQRCPECGMQIGEPAPDHVGDVSCNRAAL